MLSTALGLISALCAIATALLIGRLGADLLVRDMAPADSPILVGLLIAVLTLRALTVLVQQRTGHRAATRTIAELRERVIVHAGELGPRGSAGRGADVAALVTTGLENLRPYLVGYVPQLMLAATVTPLGLLVIGLLDLTSAVIAGLTLPLVPLFMVLVGKLTIGRSERLLADMRTLWAQLLDVVEGLPTLVALGRQRGPEAAIADLGDRHRRSAMGSLRYAFLSSMVLELLATLCVALVAVSIGLRLVAGQMELAPALAILVLVPEVYLPLRAVGQQYHASTDGLAAADAAFRILEEPVPAHGHRPAPDLSSTTLIGRGIGVRSRSGMAPFDADLRAEPGRILAITGPSGSGKTTLVQVLLGLLDPDSGSVHLRTSSAEEIPLSEMDPQSMWAQVVYLPQRPVLPPGSIREVLRTARPGAEQWELDRAASAAGLGAVIAERGADAPLGRSGRGLSLGERQRLSLARALLSPAPLVVLDEPTAHLDGGAEEHVLAALRAIREQGRTVIVIAHRESLIAVADDLVHIAARTDADADSAEVAR